MKKLHNVLVLNKGFVPIHIVDWQKAISLVYTGKVRVLDSDFVLYNLEDWLKFSQSTKDFYVLKSVNISIALPEIIVTNNFIKLRREKGITFSRQSVLERDENRCCYCGHIFAVKDLSLDHVIPKSKGGSNDWTNVVTSCKKCNNKKADRTPEQANMPMLFRPKKPEWHGSSIKKFAEAPSWNKFLGTVENKIEHNLSPDD